MEDPVKLEQLARLEREASDAGGGAAFGVFPQMRRTRTAQDPEAAKNVPVDLGRGFVSGVLGAPGDIESFARKALNWSFGPGGVKVPEQTVLPTSAEVEPHVPLRPQQQTPVGRAATELGTLGGGFYLGPGSPLKAIGALPGALAHGAQEFAQASALGAPHVVKPKGGNWLAGSVEGALQRMKTDATGRLFEEGAMYGYTPEMTTETTAINRWVDKKLGSYIRNEMGTPEDPLRALAERGVSHIAPRELEAAVSWQPESLGPRRKAAGFPEEGLATTTAGKAWEQLADEAIHNMPAHMRISPETGGGSHSALVTEQNNPWLRNVPPDTMTYGVYPVEVRRELGFEHLVDELKNALTAGNELPKSLQLTPQQLEKVTVPQAVELVSKIGKWRADQAAKAEKLGMLENLKAEPRLESPEVKLSFVDKPGMKWIDIPETSAEQGMNFCKTIGKQGGWCTADDWAAKSYGAGDNRLAVMLDADGRPHAQARISRSKSLDEAYHDLVNGEADITDWPEVFTPAQQKRVNKFIESEEFDGELGTVVDWLEHEMPDAYQRLLHKETQAPSDITELKPVENTFNGKRAEEYTKRDPQYKEKVTQSVLDFLNKGEWGRVNDLNHYGIVDLQDSGSLMDALDRLYSVPLRDSAAIFNQAIEAAPNVPRFMSKKQLREFVGPVERGEAPEGYKDGGSVRPSEAQIDAGNYAKEHRSLHGLRISVENPKGSVRSGVDKTGKEWSQKMRHDYGYIRGTEGADKDHIDVFLGEHAHDARHPVVVIDQVDPRTRKFDEHKVMMGFKTVKDAVAAYNSNYEKGWKGFHKATPMSMAAFKGWAFGGTVKQPAHKVKVEDPIMLEKLHAMGLN